MYFASTIFLGSEEAGGSAWGKAITVSSIIVAILSPIMGAIADRGGYRKLFLIFWTWVCIIFSFLLYYPLPGDVFKALLFFCIANIGFEMGGVFLNAYLPEIAPKSKIGRISGYGWSLGYVGGLIALAECYIMLIVPDSPINFITGDLLNKSDSIFFSSLAILLAIVVGSTFNFFEANFNFEHLESARKEFKSFQLNIN